MAAKWDYSFSNFGPKKQIGGTVFYRVSLGSETKWLSMEGIHVLEKARRAGVKFKTVRKAVTHFTAHGTKVRLKAMRENIMRSVEDLMGAERILLGREDFDFAQGGYGKYTKGIRTMLERAGLDTLVNEFALLLNAMNESQIREFYSKNQLLLQRFFADSDVFTSPLSTDAEIVNTSSNVRRNAEKMRDSMLRILDRDMTEKEIMKLEDLRLVDMLMKFRKGHL